MRGGGALWGRFFAFHEKLSSVHAWVMRSGSPLRPYARLMRLDKPIGTWLLLLPCWWGLAFAADPFPDLWFMFLFAFGSVVMRGAGCVVNDMYDRKLDRLVERTRDRPLASGEVGMVQASLFLGALLLVGLGVLCLFNRETILTGALSLILVFVYPWMKRVTWWPQLFLGFTFNWGVLMGGMAVAGGIGWTHLLAYIAGVFWTLGYDTIYAHQDKRDDVLAGVKSTALLFGARSKAWVALFYALTLIFLALAGWAAGDGLGRGYEGGLIVAAIFAAVHWFLWNPDDPEDCLRRFKANRDFGAIVWVAIVLGKLV